MQSIPCILAQWFQIVCSGVHPARPNASRLNAVDFMQHGPKHPDGMQWIPCSVIECRGFHALWRNGSRFYAVESMHCDSMQCNPCTVVKCIPIECSGFHAASLNAEDSLHFGAMEQLQRQHLSLNLLLRSRNASLPH